MSLYNIKTQLVNQTVDAISVNMALFLILPPKCTTGMWKFIRIFSITESPHMNLAINYLSRAMEKGVFGHMRTAEV